MAIIVSTTAVSMVEQGAVSVRTGGQAGSIHADRTQRNMARTWRASRNVEKSWLPNACACYLMDSSHRDRRQ